MCGNCHDRKSSNIRHCLPRRPGAMHQVQTRGTKRQALLSFRSIAENSSHPLCGWSLIPAESGTTCNFSRLFLWIPVSRSHKDILLPLTVPVKARAFDSDFWCSIHPGYYETIRSCCGLQTQTRPQKSGWEDSRIVRRLSSVGWKA